MNKKIFSFIFFLFLIVLGALNRAEASEYAIIHPFSTQINNIISNQKYDVSLPKENFVYIAKSQHNDLGNSNNDCLLNFCVDFLSLNNTIFNKQEFVSKKFIHNYNFVFSEIPRAP